MDRTRLEKYRWLTTICFLALFVTFAGPSFGWGQGDQQTEGFSPASPGHVPIGPEISTKIQGRKKIKVLTPSKEMTVYGPVFLSEGIASGTKGGSYDPSSLVPWGDIRTIKVFKSGFGPGAGTGALVGFALGAGLSSLLASSFAGQGEGGGYFLPIVGGGSMGALAGGLVGGLMGVASGRWETVYSAPAASRLVPRISLVPTGRGGMAMSVALSF